MIKLNGEIITPTRFPDRTTQVWKITESDRYKIEWEYSDDSEIFILSQLLDLLFEDREDDDDKIELFIPYFPYARQDKEIHNESTFALSTLMDILKSYMPELTITTIDIHSKAAIDHCVEFMKEEWVTNKEGNYIDESNFDSIINLYPKCLIKLVNSADCIVFPDKGAKDRYSKLFRKDITKYSLKKVRNQQTGEITGMDFEEGVNPHWNFGKIVVVDDICDGGRTFLGAANAICLNMICSKLELVITHGIFSNNVLLKELSTYYDTIVTTNSLYRDMKENIDWLDAAKQSAKYMILDDLRNKEQLYIYDCLPGTELKL